MILKNNYRTEPGCNENAINSIKTNKYHYFNVNNIIF
jgi:hypothetical protein